MSTSISINQCMYCRKETTGDEGEAHVLPEAIVENDVVLPRGAMCDACNQYLGELDTALATHPMIAFGIQAFALPGKKGRARDRLGKVEQSNHGDVQWLTLLPGAIDRVTKVGGRPYIVLTNPSIQVARRFHRALHHVAFNLLCKVHGPAEALSTKYDPVREYVRSPKPGEIWPYRHSNLGPNPVDVVDVVCLRARSQVILRFFNQTFAVDLLRRKTLLHELTRLFPDYQWSEVPAQYP